MMKKCNEKSVIFASRFTDFKFFTVNGMQKPFGTEFIAFVSKVQAVSESLR